MGEQSDDQLLELSIRTPNAASMFFRERLLHPLEYGASVGSESESRATVRAAPATVPAWPEAPSRIIGDQWARSEALFVLMFSIPSAHRSEFDAWFIDEHIPLLLRDPLWLRTRVISAEQRIVAIHSLASIGALESDFRRRAGETELTRGTVASEWFTPPERSIFVFAAPAPSDRDETP